MIDAVQAMEHESTIDCEILYTSYKWHLKHWSLMSDHYNKGVQSPEFDITDTKCKCQLSFEVQKTDTGFRRTYVIVDFIGSFDFCSMQMSVSFVTETMKKQIKCKSKLYNKTITETEWLEVHSGPLDAEVDKIYFQNDTLIVLFEIKHTRAIIVSPVQTIGFSRNGSNSADDISDLYDDTDFCDIKFFCKKTGVTLPAHKHVLAARSPVFRAMFKANMKEIETGIVTIEDVDDVLFEIFLWYVYTGKVRKIGNVVNELFTVANKYQVLNLVDFCEKYMIAHVNDANVINYLITAHQHSRATLEKEAIEYIKRNTHILAQAADHNLFSKFPTLVKQIFSK